jgi:hypothetical protein
VDAIGCGRAWMSGRRVDIIVVRDIVVMVNERERERGREGGEFRIEHLDSVYPILPFMSVHYPTYICIGNQPVRQPVCRLMPMHALLDSR